MATAVDAIEDDLETVLRVRASSFQERVVPVQSSAGRYAVGSTSVQPSWRAQNSMVSGTDRTLARSSPKA
jgi:hypothetical protein